MDRNRLITLGSVVGILGIVAVMVIVAVQMTGFGLPPHGGGAEYGAGGSEAPARETTAHNGTTTGAGARWTSTAGLGIEGFTEVVSRGGWQLSLRQGEEFSVLLDTGDRADGGVRAERRGSALHLVSERTVHFGTRAPRAEITMPELASLRQDGGGEIEIAGFDEPELRLESNGGAKLTVRDSSFERLLVRIRGAASVDARESLTRDADVRVDGVASVRLTMDGGVLSGRLSGAGSVEYWGSVREERVKVAGIGSVRHQPE